MSAATSLVDKTPLRQVSSVKQLLANQHAAGQLGAVAARHLNPEAMMRTLALSVSRTPKLGECTPMSLLGALMTSASLGLEVNSPLGHAYLIPFEDRRRNRVEAQLIIGYRGYLHLGNNAPDLAWVDASIHYDTDKEWDWAEGGERVLKHRPGPMTGEIEHAYAIFEKTNKGRTWVVWPEAKLAAHRDRYSKGYINDIKRGKKPTDANVNIWLADPELARRKTMIRQIAKVMPMSTQAPQALTYDGARADYASFALDPGFGPAAIEAPGEGIVGDEVEGIIETDEPAAIEQRQDQAIPAATGEKALADTAAAIQSIAGVAEPAAQTDAAAARATAQERARAAVEARRAKAAEAAVPEPQQAAATREPDADDEVQAKYRGWADRIRIDIDDLGTSAFDDWAEQMAILEKEAPALAAELRAYANGEA